MIGSLAALLAFQLAGEILVRLTGLPLPGPVLGMLLLFVALLARGRTPPVFAETTRGLLTYLGLLFVPAGVGIISHLDRVAGEWLGIAVTLLASTALALVATAFTLRYMLRRQGD